MNIPVVTGEVLDGRYAIERELGQGGMARVYLVRDLRHGRSLALKMVRPEVSATLGADRFLSEIEIISKMTHPNILPLHDSGTIRGQLYYVSPFMDGKSLRERMNATPQMPIADVISITREVAQALDYAHSRGIIHRDIKPENILFSGGVAVVADFGIARAVVAAGGDRLTQAGVVVGTPAYMSPEQATGEVTDARSDVYSLACVVYEMLTGRPPFSGEISLEVMLKHARESAPALRQVRSSVPLAVEVVVMRAMAKAPADRFPTVRAFADALIEAVGGTAPLPVATPGPSRRTVQVVIGAAALVIVSAFAVIATQRPKVPAGPPRLMVLPFEHLGDAEDKFITEGLADEVTSRVAGLSGLSVVARTTAQQYPATGVNLRNVAREVGVSYLVTATVRTDRAPDGTRRVRVTPHLVAATDGQDVWSDRYDASFVPGELFALQSSIAERVAGALGVSVLTPESRLLAARPTQSTAAYTAYLQANILSSRRYEEASAREAIALYEQAIKSDSNFALAWAKLAEASAVYDYYYRDKNAARLGRAQEALRRATAIDSTLPELAVARGFVAWWGELDAAKAFRELSAVRKSQPNNSELLWIIGQIERRQGKIPAAAATMQSAAILDPRSHVVALDLGLTLLSMRRFEDAEREIQRARRLSPDWAPAVVMQALMLWSRDGTITAASATIDSAAPRVSMREMVKWMYRYPSMPTALGGAVRDSVLALTTTADFVDPAKLHLAKAYIARDRGDSTVARLQFDSARRVLEPRVRAAESDAELRALLGISYAGVGRRDDAAREGDRALALMPLSREFILGSTMLSHRIDIAVISGDTETALKHIETVLRIPSQFSKAMIRSDRFYVDLRSTPRFKAITAGPERTF
jgi:serine/threonine-protein kinase